MFHHRAKLTGKLEKGREKALGSESLVLLELLLAGLSSGEKKSVVLGKAVKGKILLLGQKAKGTCPAPHLPS